MFYEPDQTQVMKLHLNVTVEVSSNDEVVSSINGDAEEWIKEEVHHAIHSVLSHVGSNKPLDWQWTDVDLIEKMEVVEVSNPVE